MCPTGVVVAIETPHGTLVKVPQHVTSEEYSSALSQRDAQAVMAGLLGIVAAHRGVQHAPLAMLASQTKVLSSYTSHTWTTGSPCPSMVNLPVDATSCPRYITPPPFHAPLPRQHCST